MKRRAFLTGLGVMAVLSSAQAQKQGKVPRVGVLHAGSSKEPPAAQREPFERGLRELGWVPGSTVLIDYRYAEGNAARLADLAADLVRSGVDVIVARAPVAIHAARKATTTIPIVMSAGGHDPVGDGVAKNLSRPGLNVTGILSLIAELDGKRLELLKETFPRASRVAVLANPNIDAGRYPKNFEVLKEKARSLNLQLQAFDITRADELPGALSAIGQAQVDALLVRGDPEVLDPRRSEIVAVAAKHRLPAVYPWRFFAEVGGLMSYGTSFPGMHHRAASFVSRILKGANAGDLAIEQPTKFDLVVNVKTAKALGLEIPKAVLFRADEIIQ